MAGERIRIFSDVHFGDRASRVRRLEQLQPLLTDVDRVIFNGDTLDTRTGPYPERTAAWRRAVEQLAATSAVPLTFLTGNHDPDLSDLHALELAAGRVFVVHGDVLFDDMVPWGRDARQIRRLLRRALHSRGAGQGHLPLEERLALWREVAVAIPQRHQAEPNPVKYAWRFFSDTVWPPTRFLRIFRAWSNEPTLAARLLAPHRPRAGFILLGHTHRPRIHQPAGGPIVINTGSFTAPFGGTCVEIDEDRLQVRRIEFRDGTFQPGVTVAEFPLASAAAPAFLGGQQGAR